MMNGVAAEGKTLLIKQMSRSVKAIQAKRARMKKESGHIVDVFKLAT